MFTYLIPKGLCSLQQKCSEYIHASMLMKTCIRTCKYMKIDTFAKYYQLDQVPRKGLNK